MTTVSEALAQAWQMHQAGDTQQAERLYRQVLQVAPANANAWCYLGMACHDLRRLDEAVGAYRQALRLKPSFPTAYNNLGNTLSEQGRLDEALASFGQAIALKRDYANAYSNRAAVLVKQGRLSEAAEDFQRALRLAPNHAPAHANLGATLVKQGKLEEAQARLQAALRIDPGYAEAHKNLAIVWLMQGDFQRGWPEYEWRWKTRELSLPTLDRPLWDGSSLAGKTVLLHAEQGLGDAVHFIRYAELLKPHAARVIAACPKPLFPLLRSCPGIDEVVAKGDDLPDFDVYAPLLSLPRILRTTLQTIPANVPYLFAAPSLAEHWRRELADAGTFRIGIAWQGSPQYRDDRLRSIPLDHFAALARIEGVRLFSLQKGPGAEQLAALGGRGAVLDLAQRLDTSSGPFMDTAAVMKNLDLVIAADTVIAHLAGALAVPVWTALCHVADWRWMRERDDSPWYPTMRLFRQRRPGDWQDVFERIEAALRELLQQSHRFPAGAPFPVEQPERSAPADPGKPATVPSARSIRVQVAPGELVDKITILEIKAERIADPCKSRHVRGELEMLASARDRALPPSAELADLTAQLQAVNEALWRIEDALRDCERREDFGPEFVELARSVYRTNDRRAALKRQINELFGAAWIEEKSYTPYE